MTSASAPENRAPQSAEVPGGQEGANGFGAATPRQEDAAALALEQHQKLLKQRLARPLLDLFHQLTGLRLHVWWHKPGSELPPSALRKLCSQTREGRSAKLLQICEECLRTQWPQDWTGLQPERRFDCQCGLTNYYACLRIQDQPVVTLLVQQPTPALRAAKKAFSGAISLTQLILHDLRGTLVTEPHPPLLNNSHRQQLVQRMQDYIHQHYSHPIELHDLAAALNLNASYVSSLFSTTLGVTFHHYLEELRLARARELLRDPARRVSEVAYAVGYSNPNHFCNVFTTRIGLSPSAWRELQPA